MLEQGYPYSPGRGPLSRRQFLHVGTWAGLGIAAGAMSCAAPWPRQVWAQQTNDTPRTGGVLTMWIGGDPPNFDVHQNSTYLTQHITAPCYNNLVQYDPLDPKRIGQTSLSAGKSAPTACATLFTWSKGCASMMGNPAVARTSR